MVQPCPLENLFVIIRGGRGGKRETEECVYAPEDPNDVPCCHAKKQQLLLLISPLPAHFSMTSFRISQSIASDLEPQYSSFNELIGTIFLSVGISYGTLFIRYNNFGPNSHNKFLKSIYGAPKGKAMCLSVAAEKSVLKDAEASKLSSEPSQSGQWYVAFFKGVFIPFSVRLFSSSPLFFPIQSRHSSTRYVMALTSRNSTCSFDIVL